MRTASAPLRVTGALLGLSLLLTAAPPAFGQAATQQSAAAQVAFDEAMKLMREGRTAEACPKFKSAQNLDPGMATQFRLAECYEKLGQLASAWANFVEVADAAKATKSKERESFARKRAAALEPRLSRLTILVSPALTTLQGLEIKRDGVVVDRALWGTAVPVDPGEHVVVATAPGKKPWEGKGVATEQPTKLDVTVPPLEDLPAPPPASPEPPPASLPTQHGRSIVPAIVGGATAVAAVGMGLTFLLVSNGKQADALDQDNQLIMRRENCRTTPDSTACVNLVNTARSVDTYRYISAGAFIGAGALVAATLAYVLWPSPRPKKTGLDIHAAPVVGHDHGSMVVWGAF